MITTVIIDDEARSRDILREMLARFCPDVTVLGEASDLDTAIRLIAALKPNLAFLDINMPNGSGFDVLKAFPQANFEVVFITAHNEYAIQAIRASALDYLLKPLNIAELQECVQRTKLKLLKDHERNNLGMLVENLRSNMGVQDKIALPEKQGLQFVNIKDIIRLEADGNYTRLYFSGRKPILSTRHLKEYEDLLPPHVFFRSHHSHIVNLDHIESYQRGEGGSIIMSDKSEVQVARRRKKLFLDIFHADHR